MLLAFIGLRLLLAQDLPYYLDAQADPRDRLLGLLELEPAVDLVPEIYFDFVLSSRRGY